MAARKSKKEKEYEVGDIIKVEDPVIKNLLERQQIISAGIKAQTATLVELKGQADKDFWDEINKHFPQLKKFNLRVNHEEETIELRQFKGEW